MNTILMTAKNENAPEKTMQMSAMSVNVVFTPNPKLLAFRTRFGMGKFEVEVNGFVGKVEGTDGYRVKTTSKVSGGKFQCEACRGVRLDTAFATQGKTDWDEAIRNHFKLVYNVEFKGEITKPVVTVFSKEVDRLDFAVRYCDAMGRYSTVDGFVARLLGTNRYYVNASVVTVEWGACEYDRFGKNELVFGRWYQTSGHYTMLGAIRHHLETVWGIPIADGMGLELPALPTFVRIEATKKVMAVVLDQKFNGTKDEHRATAKAFADEVVKSGEFFLRKCPDFPRPAQIALFNLDTTGVLMKWDDLYGVHPVEEGDDVEEVAV